METVVKATTPRVRAGLGFVRASNRLQLQRQKPNATDSQRTFQIQQGAIPGVGEFVGPCYEVHHEMSIVIRYLYDEGQGEEWAEIRNMSADDAALLTAALPRPPISAPWSSSGVWGIRPVDGAHEPLEQNEEFDGVWEQRIVFDVLYNALETPRDFECFGIYADFAALSATDGSTTWLGSSRNELRRLVDGALYEWDGGEGEWVLLSSGSAGLVTEHTTLNSLFAQAGSLYDRALLKTSTGAEVSIGRHDGTRWVLGEIDLVAAGAEGATIFAGYTASEGPAIVWTANGLEVDGTVSNQVFLQFASAPLSWVTDIRRVVVCAEGRLQSTQRAGQVIEVGSAWGIAGARTYIGRAGMQWQSATTKRALIVYGLNTGLSVAVSPDFAGTGVGENPYVDCGMLGSTSSHLAIAQTDSSAGAAADVSPATATTGISSVNSVQDFAMRAFDDSGQRVIYTKLCIQLHRTP
jgi:hypothetical protein